MQLKTVRLSDIKPYPNNPRKNDEAVEAVAESVRQCGYRSRIIVDENMVIIAGHTRYEALKRLGWTEAEVQVETDMPEETKRKYRLLDNKTNELAGWDFEKLETELEGIDFDGFDFGFHRADGGDLDSLFSEAPTKEPEEPKEIQCPHCKMWFTP